MLIVAVALFVLAFLLLAVAFLETLMGLGPWSAPAQISDRAITLCIKAGLGCFVGGLMACGLALFN